MPAWRQAGCSYDGRSALVGESVLRGAAAGVKKR
jgi:hypothetical protein